MKMKVLIVDDHHVVRRGLRFFLETQDDIDVVGEAENGAIAIERIKEYHPDVVLMDLAMPVMDGIEAMKQIKELALPTKVIILTSFSDQDHAIPAIKAGAVGYQLKDIDPDELVHSIRAVFCGESKIHPKITSHLLTHVTGKTEEKNLLASLTPREKEVLKEILNGKSNKEIADCLVITEKTVKTHVSNVLSKLEVADRTQAALYAIKHELK
ncbi:response regulator [Alkalihalobacterium bogoriense]|uniref:response regulator n=1 Tax=Alkalihalobacterium bogoriense TaxID=246272 RepID=UPI00047D1DF2|nr:response regulator transcription factor [Alkalihalobacterium bogoriense]